MRCSATMRALARLARQRGARHRGGGQTLRCSATIHATSRLARLRGARHCACGNLAAQREDACIARRPRLRGARRRACEKILRCNARMPAPAGLARQRGARHRGGGQTLRWLASVWMSSLLDLTPCSALCGLCILVDTTNATFFTHAAGLRDCCFLARQNVGHLGYDGFETLEIFL